MKFGQISNNVYSNTDGEAGCNVGIIIIEDRIVAVDAKYPVSGYDFRRSIPTVSDKPVTHLLLTHYHEDHIFGSQAFEDCEIVSHILVKDRVEENLKTLWAQANISRLIEDVRKNRPEAAPFYNGLRIVLPTKTFKNRFSLDGIQMVHTGGHTACSSVVNVSCDKVLFAGDLLFAQSFPWAGDPSADPDEWIEAFKTILRMDVDTIIPGHGPTCDKQEVRIQLKWFEDVRHEMKKLIEEGKSMEEAIRCEGYPQFYKAEYPDWRKNSLAQWYKVWTMKKDKIK